MIVPDLEELYRSIHIKNEDFCYKKYPEFTEYIIRLYPDISHIERLYRYFNNDCSCTCRTCGKPTRFISFNRGYTKYCSAGCASKNDDVKTKKKNTTLKNYGVENPSQSKEINDRKKNTLLNRYGDENYNNREKAKQTCLDRYGEEHFFNKEKSKQTCLERYGTEYFLSDASVISRINETCKKKYGGRGNASKILKDKMKNTCLERYGDENYNNREKARQTCLEKYGQYYFPRPKKEKVIQSKRVLTEQEIKNIHDNKRIKCSKKATQSNENILDVFLRDDILYYKCSCPHDDCNKCKEKSFIIRSNIYSNRKSTNIELCTKLMSVQNDRIKDTSIELFIRSILDKHNIYYITNVRHVIKSKELDIYIPSKKIAIECNGIYWHSDKNVDKDKHYSKFKLCQEQNIQLLTVWEDQIRNYPNKVESIILSKLGIYNNRIYARNCIIKEVPSKECNEFLSHYHLQGKTNSSIRLGLYYNDELISVMTFGKGRKCLNSNTKYELYRYCCKTGVQVIGGASKLFKYFLKEYEPESIESFSSNDISNGDLYKQLGFEYVSNSIGYWYIDKEMNRYHRYKFTKYSLISEGFDPNKTEFEIMDERGFFRIYDSGQTKWVWKNSI